MRIFSIVLLSALALLAAALTVLKPQIGGIVFKRAIERSIPRNLTTDLPDGLHVGLCGTGSPMSDVSRKGPCTFVIANGALFVVDVGSGAARNFGPMGVRPGDAQALFLTHFHSDHIDGLGDFLTQRWANSGANEPLPIYGPEGVNIVVDGINAAYSLDKIYRVDHHGADVMAPSGFGGAARKFDVAPGEARIILESGGVKVTAFTVDHGGVEPAVGYRFDYKGRSVVISGDTAKSENLARFAAGADLLIHETLNPDMVNHMGAQFAADGRPRLEKIFEQIKEIHTTPVEAAEIAEEAGVKMLVASHIVPPAPMPYLSGYFLKSAGDKFSGKIIFGQDGMVFSMPPQSADISLRKAL